MNLSKLVDEDEPLFMSLIEDMFPGIKIKVHVYKELQKAIANATVALGIMNNPEWNLKTVQVCSTTLKIIQDDNIPRISSCMKLLWFAMV